MTDCGHAQCEGSVGGRCLFPNAKDSDCPRCGVRMVEVDDLVWFRDGRGWQHRDCADRALAAIGSEFV